MGKTVQFWVALALGAAVILAPAGVRAQTQDSVDSLKKMVEDLTKRLEEVTQKLDAVEKKQAEQPAAAPAVAAPTPAPKPKGLMDVYWKEGLRLESAEAENGVKPFQLRIGGRIQTDASWMTEDDDLASVAESEDGIEFRRARIQISGIVYRDFDFQLEYDFAEGKSAPKDVYVSANNIPVVGTLRIGHYKEFGSLDELVSDNDTMLIERGLPNIFAPSRNLGIGLTNAFLDKRMTASLGAFRETDELGNGAAGDDNWAVTARVTGLPYYYAVKNDRVDKLQLVHLGGWTSYREREVSNFSISQRPENHLAPKYINTFQQIGPIDSQFLFGAEAALIYGPFTAQTEYIMDSINRSGADTVMMQGAYAQVGYILTGEHRLYRNQTGVLDKVVPLKNFQLSGDLRGPGAWELVARYSWLDLEDEDVDGGQQQDVTAGVNWFLNPNMRVSFNYIHGWIERDSEVTINPGASNERIFPAIDGDYDGFLMRFQITW